MYINIVLILFPNSGLSGMLCSGGKENNDWTGAVGVGIDVLSISSHGQIQ